MTATLIVEPKEAVQKLKRKPVGKDLKTLARLINETHFNVEEAMHEAITCAMACGDLLIEAKSKCAHGEWSKWLADNFKGSDRSARVYMRLANHRELIEAKRQSSADLTIENALSYITPKVEKVEPVDPQQLELHERRIEEELAGAVLELDEIVAAADVFRQSHEEAFRARYPEGSNPVDTVSFEEHKQQVEQWRSAEWFPEAEKRVRAQRDNPIQAGEIENTLGLIGAIEKARAKATQHFLTWSKDARALLATPELTADESERIRCEAVWWDKVCNVSGTWEHEVKPGHWHAKHEGATR